MASSTKPPEQKRKTRAATAKRKSVRKSTKRMVPAGTSHDDEILERARMQWQFGDWESLAALDEGVIKAHPKRARLAALTATAHQQLNDHASARHMVDVALRWGCDKPTLSRLLIASVHNTLGRVAALMHDDASALQHFLAAVDGVRGDTRLACQARSVREVARLGMYGRAGKLIEQHLGLPQPPPGIALPTAEALRDISDSMQDSAHSLAVECLSVDDSLAAIDARLTAPEMDRQTAFLFCIALAKEFKNRKDNVTAVNFLNTAQEYLDRDNPDAVSRLSRSMLSLGQHAGAIDLLVGNAVRQTGLDDREKQALNNVYAQIRARTENQGAHGHALLLGYLERHLQEFKQAITDRKLRLIEIGSTRENVPAQGSTRQIAEFCKSQNVDFITVDMDPHNTAAAASMFKKLGTDFTAINRKGEDFLRTFDDELDFVFLDAYDFDHGNHSELRQSRYVKFLGSRIDEAECHRMHLDCAESLSAKLPPHGLVCVDDTWLTDGRWCAKGTLAMPYLLAHGFELIEARNRAALLRRARSIP